MALSEHTLTTAKSAQAKFVKRRPMSALGQADIGTITVVQGVTPDKRFGARPLTLIGRFRRICHHFRKFLDEVRLRAFWQVECQQFPVTIDYFNLNSESLVVSSFNRNGYIKCSSSLIRVYPVLPCAGKTVR